MGRAADLMHCSFLKNRKTKTGRTRKTEHNSKLRKLVKVGLKLE